MQAARIKHSSEVKNRWIRLVFLAVVWLLIWSLISDFARVRKGFLRVDESKDRLTQVQKENQELKERTMNVQTDYYQERLIRDKLNMQLPGETVVVLPEKTDKTETQAKENEESVPNWEKWWKLIK